MFPSCGILRRTHFVSLRHRLWLLARDQRLITSAGEVASVFNILVIGGEGEGGDTNSAL